MTLIRKTPMPRSTKPLARSAIRSEPKTEGQPKPPRARRCKVSDCRKQFIPDRPFVVWCSESCGAVIAQAKLAKQKQAQVAAAKRAKKAEGVCDREKAESMKTLPQLLKEAQYWFNRSIRFRDMLAGYACISSGKPLDWSGNATDAGHFRSVGSAPHLRFNEDNCHAQSKHDNRFLSGNAVEYRSGLIKRIGLERVEALESNNEVHKWTHDEVRSIRDTYRQKANQLEKELKNA